jgi:hypothetical protein
MCTTLKRWGLTFVMLVILLLGSGIVKRPDVTGQFGFSAFLLSQ